MMENSFIRSFVLVICTFALSIPSLAQDDNVEQGKVFDVVEQMPEFDGAEISVIDSTTGETKTLEIEKGDKGLMDYLKYTVKYPVVAEENGIQGRVICIFVVEKDGTVSNVKVIKSVDPSLDKEALRVLKSMPKWKPGKQNGKPVRVQYTVPVTFRLR